jgi:hypothetical protein
MLVCWILSRINRLFIPPIKRGGVFGKDLLIGLGAFILLTIAAIVLLILQLFLLAFLIPAKVFLQIIAAMLVLPIYVGNFIKNTWNIKLGIIWVIV